MLPSEPVAPVIFLVVGLGCALIARALLIAAAFQVSMWWGLGIFLPFGPLWFRLSYPDQSATSRKLSLVSIPCLFDYIVLGPGPAYKAHLASVTGKFSHLSGYGTEKAKPSPSPTVHVPTLEERRSANTHEFERLRVWSEKLRLKKRDLLHSDVDGNGAYTAEMSQYNVDLSKATAERAALWPAAKAK